MIFMECTADHIDSEFDCHFVRQTWLLGNDFSYKNFDEVTIYLKDDIMSSYESSTESILNIDTIQLLGYVKEYNNFLVASKNLNISNSSDTPNDEVSQDDKISGNKHIDFVDSNKIDNEQNIIPTCLQLVEVDTNTVDGSSQNSENCLKVDIFKLDEDNPKTPINKRKKGGKKVTDTPLIIPVRDFYDRLAKTPAKIHSQLWKKLS